jgi:hypothetical protein
MRVIAVCQRNRRWAACPVGDYSLPHHPRSGRLITHTLSSRSRKTAPGPPRTRSRFLHALTERRLIIRRPFASIPPPPTPKKDEGGQPPSGKFSHVKPRPHFLLSSPTHDFIEEAFMILPFEKKPGSKSTHIETENPLSLYFNVSLSTHSIELPSSNTFLFLLNKSIYISSLELL